MDTLGDENMGQKIYFWVLMVLFLTLGLLIQIQKANAFVAAEVEPGIVELSTTSIYGFEVKEVASKTIKGKEWVYFCVNERKSRKSKRTKCFYGLKQDFREVEVGKIINGIRYGLKYRIYNSSGNIPLKKNAYRLYRLLLKVTS